MNSKTLGDFAERGKGKALGLAHLESGIFTPPRRQERQGIT
jgi:hypothetical protein